MPEITYGQLDTILQSLGFAATVVDGKIRPGRFYYHEATGAAATLPQFPDNQKVQSGHLAVVATLLDSFGIPVPREITAPLPRAS